MGRAAGHDINRDAWADIVALNDLTAEKVAAAGGMPVGTVRAIACGAQRASIESAHKIAKGAGCRVRTLFPSLNPALDAKPTAA